MLQPDVILASTSPFRKALLAKLGIPFQVQSPQIDETPLENETAHELVSRLAQAKAEAIGRLHDQAIIIGSDQVCSVDGLILGKPGNAENAIAQLTRLSGRLVRFETGLCLYQGMRHQTVVEAFDVKFRTLSQQQIQRYVEIEQPYHCAGSFMSEGLGICLFEHFAGRDPNTLIGLPLMALTDLLADWGISLPL